MSSILKTTPLNYRIKVEKISGDGTIELVGDTGFVKPQTIELVKFLVKLMDLDLENKESKNKLDKELLDLK